MKVVVRPQEFDLWQLFVHDSYPHLGVDDYSLSEVINEALADAGAEWLLAVSPRESGLSRWTLRRNHPSGEHEAIIKDRPHSVGEVKSQIGASVAEAIGRINSLTVIVPGDSRGVMTVAQSMAWAVITEDDAVAACALADFLKEQKS